MLDTLAPRAHDTAMNNHLKGLMITALGVMFIVPDALFVRLIEAEALAIAFWRGLFAGLLVLGLVTWTMGRGAVGNVLRAGPPAWGYMVLYGLSAPGFVVAISLTSVANVVFILAAMPVFATIFSRIWLGEPIVPRMVWTMVGVFLGLGVILIGSKEQAGAHWTGDLVALGVALFFAAALTCVRQVRAQSMLPAVPVALIGGALLIQLFVDVLAPFAEFWPLFLGHGLFIAFASGLLVLGPRYLSSAEVALLLLLETTLAPLLVWAVMGEDPGRWTLLGGAIMISVLVISNLVALRRRRIRPGAGG